MLRPTIDILCFVYLDDWVVLAESRELCRLALRQSFRLLISLGFLINKEKSVLTPSRSLCWLGVEIDTYYLKWRLPTDGANLILEVSLIFRSRMVSRRQIVSSGIYGVLGADPPGGFWKKLLSSLLKGWPTTGDRDRLFRAKPKLSRYCFGGHLERTSKCGLRSTSLQSTSGSRQMLPFLAGAITHTLSSTSPGLGLL